MSLWRKSFPGRGYSWSEGPQVGVFLWVWKGPGAQLCGAECWQKEAAGAAVRCVKMHDLLGTVP